MLAMSDCNQPIRLAARAVPILRLCCTCCAHALLAVPCCARAVACREGINIFLAGFVPTENLRFREESLTFKVGAVSVSVPCLSLCLRSSLPAY